MGERKDEQPQQLVRKNRKWLQEATTSRASGQAQRSLAKRQKTRSRPSPTDRRLALVKMLVGGGFLAKHLHREAALQGYLRLLTGSHLQWRGALAAPCPQPALCGFSRESAFRRRRDWAAAESLGLSRLSCHLRANMAVFTSFA